MRTFPPSCINPDSQLLGLTTNSNVCARGNNGSLVLPRRLASELFGSTTKPISETPLTHWGPVTHICVGKLTIIGSDNGLSPGRRQAIIWTNAGLLSIETLQTYFSENLIKIQPFSFKKMHVKTSSAKWRLFRLGLNELKHCGRPGGLTWTNYLASDWLRVTASPSGNIFDLKKKETLSISVLTEKCKLLLYATSKAEVLRSQFSSVFTKNEDEDTA